MTTTAIASPAFQSDGTPVPQYDLNCPTRDYAYYILNKGNGYLPVWREFVRQMNYRAANVEAYTPHFVLVSRLIWRSCRNLFLPDECAAVMNAAADKAGQEALFVRVIENDRVYSASVNSPTRFARRRTPAAPVAAVPPNVIAAPPREAEPTGSINQPKPPAPPAR